MLPDEIIAADVDESPHKNELPDHYALRIAEAKARQVAQKRPDAVILAADTVVACGRRLLPKTDDAAQAKHYLQLLSGRRHRVYTAVCTLHREKLSTKLVVTQVKYKRLSTLDIDNYIKSGEWKDKAGGYAIQGLAAAFIPWISGSYSNVVGLPLTETLTLLSRA